MSLSQALDAALERIRPEYRTAIVLAASGGARYVEIAHVTGWPIGTVKTYLHRARTGAGARARGGRLGARTALKHEPGPARRNL